MALNSVQDACSDCTSSPTQANSNLENIYTEIQMHIFWIILTIANFMRWMWSNALGRCRQACKCLAYVVILEVARKHHQVILLVLNLAVIYSNDTLWLHCRKIQAWLYVIWPEHMCVAKEPSHNGSLQRTICLSFSTKLDWNSYKSQYSNI